MDKAQLALNRCDELEELIHKKTSKTENSSSQDSVIDLTSEEPVKIVFEELLLKTHTYYTLKLKPTGVVVPLHISGNINYGYTDTFTINVYLNDRLVGNQELTSIPGGLTPFSITACLYPLFETNYLNIQILGNHVSRKNTFVIKDFVLYTKKNIELSGHIMETQSIDKKINPISVTMMDGLNMSNEYHKKYAIAHLESDGMYVAEGDGEDFSLDKCNITSHPDVSLLDPFIISYNVQPAENIEDIRYRYLVSYFKNKDSGRSCYENISVLQGVYDASAVLFDRKLVAVPGMGTSYKYIRVGGLYTTDNKDLCSQLYLETTTNGVYPNIYGSTYGNVEDIVLPMPRNLAQVYADGHAVIIAKDLVRILRFNYSLQPAIVDMPELPQALKSLVYDNDEGTSFSLYAITDGYMKKYTLTYDTSTKKYTYQSHQTIGYGIREIFPLADNDCIFMHGNKVYFTHNIEEIKC